MKEIVYVVVTILVYDRHNLEGVYKDLQAAKQQARLVRQKEEVIGAYIQKHVLIR